MAEKKTVSDLPPETLKATKQRTLFKKKRAGVVLSREEVRATIEGRKRLRRELRANGIRSKKEFELTASSLGLYFDKNRFWGLLLWFFHGRGLWALLGAMAAMIAALFLFSTVSQMRGHFTINLSGGLFREGFTLSETKDFAAPTTRLFAEPVVDVPCISVVEIAEDVPEVDGQYPNQPYFAYTFYLRNEGESTVDYLWELVINSESQDLSKAAWFMVFEDDKMGIFAEASADGGAEALPAFGDDTRGYRERPLAEYAPNKDSLYWLIRMVNSTAYYRLVPEKFETEERITSGEMTGVAPADVHKYTVVIWLEGDDPDCTDDKIGGHLGVDMRFRLVSEEEEKTSGWKNFWEDLLFWGQ